ncbi:MAG TPA: diguanylate cyclase [Nevskiaceae bacterium]|nr:diguanylate cyclase [Nevskiaceae bacterium]
MIYRNEQDQILGALDASRHEQLIAGEPARYTEMVRNITGYGVHLVDREGRIQSWNRGAGIITGYAPQDVIGQPYSTVFAESALKEGAPGRTLNFARANRHCRDQHLRKKRNGGEFLAHATLDAVRGADGQIIGFVEVFQDVTEQKQREDRLYQRATRDALTGLFNRGHFTEMGTQEIERARRFAEPLSIVLMDIDHFKKINDTWGHETGDQALIALANAVNGFIRKIDFVGRLGGEEFALALPRANKEPALDMAQRLRLHIAALKLGSAGKEFSFTISMGIAALRPDTRDLQELLRNADAALYRAKREGRNRVEVWFE